MCLAGAGWGRGGCGVGVGRGAAVSSLELEVPGKKRREIKGGHDIIVEEFGTHTANWNVAHRRMETFHVEDHKQLFNLNVSVESTSRFIILCLFVFCSFFVKPISIAIESNAFS